MLMSAGLPAAGTFSGTRAEPVFIAVSADRDAVLALAFPSVVKLPDCSPANLTVENGSFTATYQRASAFTDADQSFAVIASLGASALPISSAWRPKTGPCLSRQRCPWPTPRLPQRGELPHRLH